jgi:hypothetical protein
MSNNNSKLVLHCGADTVSREQVDAVVTPESTKTWTAVPHGVLVDSVVGSIEAGGLSIREQSFALTRNGDRLFGLLTLGGVDDGGDHAVTVGIRNSHDKTFPVGLAIGSRVFVCDNLAFSSEVTIKTKHTRLVLDRLPSLVADGVSRLVEHRHVQEKRIACYKEAEVAGQAHLHDLVLRAYRAKAIPARAIAEVVAEFEEPRHPEFRDWTLWSLFNGFTEVLKEYGDLQPRTQRLHGVFDSEVGPKLLAV